MSNLHKLYQFISLYQFATVGANTMIFGTESSSLTWWAAFAICILLIKSIQSKLTLTVNGNQFRHNCLSSDKGIPSTGNAAVSAHVHTWQYSRCISWCIPAMVHELDWKASNKSSAVSLSQYLHSRIYHDFNIVEKNSDRRNAIATYICRWGLSISYPVTFPD